MWLLINNSFHEINEIKKDEFVEVKRQIVAQPTEQGLGFVELHSMHPMFKSCSKHFLNLNNVMSYSIVNENSEEWVQIKQVALGENGIIKPDLKVIS